MTATELNEKPDDLKTSRKLTVIGERTQKIYYTFTFAEEANSMMLDQVIAKLYQYMNSRKNMLSLQYKFFSNNQNDVQNIDDYVTSWALKSSHCVFAT